jgi:hypothetical protein
LPGGARPCLDNKQLPYFLAQELEWDEDSLIEPGRSYPIWSPDRAFTAAAALLQALEDEKGQPQPAEAFL